MEVAELLKLVCKTFWSATYMEIPAQLAEPAAFAGWMTALHTFVSQPVPEVSPFPPTSVVLKRCVGPVWPC